MRCIAGCLIIAAAGIALGQSGSPGSNYLRSFADPNPWPINCFGDTVAAIGNNVLVGTLDYTTVSWTGAVHMYDSTTGALLRTFTNPTPKAYDCFSHSLAGLGGTVVVGAYGDDAAGTDTGAVHLFDASTGNLVRTLLPPDPVSYVDFGISVAPFGSDLLVSARGIGVNYTSGAVYLFDDSTGALLRTYLNPDAARYDGFGGVRAVMGPNLLVGAHDSIDNTRAVLLLDGSTGALLRTFRKPIPSSSDSFGYEVAVVGDNVFISARDDDTAAADAGAVYMFDGSTGALLRTFLKPGAASHDAFGASIAAFGNRLVVGVPNDDVDATNGGAAYMFHTATGALVDTFLNPEPAATDWFGNAVATVGTNVVVAAHGNGDDVGYENTGAAYLFTPEPATLSLLALGGVAVMRRRKSCLP